MVPRICQVIVINNYFLIFTGFFSAGSDLDGDLTEVAPREKAAGRRAAASKPTKYDLVSSVPIAFLTLYPS